MALLSAALALLLGGRASALASSIVYDTGGYVYFVNDDGSSGGTIGPGSEPQVSPDGRTVVFAGNEDGLACKHTVFGWQVGAASGAVTPLASDFANCAKEPGAGIGGRYLFGVETYAGADSKVRQGSLNAPGSAQVGICQSLTPWSPWQRTVDHPTEPSPSPVGDEFVFHGCEYRQCPDDWPTCSTVGFTSYDFLTLAKASGEEVPLLYSESYFDEPSWSPDGRQLVFILSRHTDTPDPAEGIYVTDVSNPTNLRRVFARTETFGHIYSPRITGNGQVIFDYENKVSGPDGILAIPKDCSHCTLANATFLAAGHNPAWTATTIHALPGSGGGGQPQDVRAAVISGVRVTSRRWQRGSQLPRFSRVPTGTTILFRLDEQATATLTFERALPGRRVNGRCRAPNRTNRSRAKCTRYATIGKLVRQGALVGLNRVLFQGRLSRRVVLPLGSYRVTVGAKDAAGNLSIPRSTSFSIVRAERKGKRE